MIVETRPGINGGPDEWRIVDPEKRVRTPWMAGDARATAEVPARLAVERTHRTRLSPTRHTTDGDG